MADLRFRRNVTAAVIVAAWWIFLGVAVAQVEAEAIPLYQALQVSGVGAGVDLVIAQVPEVSVHMPVHADDWRDVLDMLAVVHDLTLCEIGPRTLLVSGAASAARLCSVEIAEVVTDEGPGAVSVGEPVEVAAVEPAEQPESFDVRLRVVEISEQAGISAGLDWSGAVFDTVTSLVVGDLAGAARRLVSGDVTSAIRFLESEGVGRRVDDLSVRARTGLASVLRSGGDISVNLVGAGNENISRSYAYGLSLTVTPLLREAEGIPFVLSVDSSTPINVSSPELLTLSRRSISNEVRLVCGEAAVIGSLYRESEDYAGQGLPGLAEIPAVGFAFGTLGHNRATSSIVLILEVECLS